MTDDLDGLLARIRVAVAAHHAALGARGTARRLGLPGDRYVRDLLAGRDCRLRTLRSIAAGLERIAAGRTTP